jgi:hypothetical protein
MSQCNDCGKPVEYGRGWGGQGVCATCRGKRGAASAKRRAALSGKVHGDKRGSDPLVAQRRTW